MWENASSPFRRTSRTALKNSIVWTTRWKRTSDYYSSRSNRHYDHSRVTAKIIAKWEWMEDTNRGARTKILYPIVRLQLPIVGLIRDNNVRWTLKLGFIIETVCIASWQHSSWRCLTSIYLWCDSYSSSHAGLMKPLEACDAWRPTILFANFKILLHLHSMAKLFNVDKWKCLQ